MVASTQQVRWLSCAALLALCACNHADGEVCQNKRDCEDGLVCAIVKDDRGVCRDPATLDAGPQQQGDAGPEPLKDGGMDGGMDAGPNAVPDAATLSDAGPGPDEDAAVADQDGG